MVNIQNKQILIDCFGFWPSFHDAEILRLRLEREGDDSPYLEADIHVFHMTNEVDEKGYFILRNHTLVTFRFGGIELEFLEDFNHQNVLDSLDFSKKEGQEDIIKVEFVSNYGCNSKFTCKFIKVLSATPYNKS